MPKPHHRTQSRLPQLLAIGGVVILVLATLLIKGKPQAAAPSVDPSQLAEHQLDRALADHKPILAFFHSNNCKQCLIMIDTVNQVYPEFSASIELVDVNVYDQNNAQLLKRVGLQYIPTLIFFDHAGKQHVIVGVIEANQLHQTLSDLVAGE